MLAKIVDFMFNLFKRGYTLPTNWFFFLVQGVGFSEFPRVAGILNIKNRGKISIGKSVKITSCSNSNPVGGAQETSLYCSPEGSITIGDNVSISNCVIFSQKNIKIKKGAMIGGGCQIYDSDFHSLIVEERLKEVPETIGRAAVVIGNNSFIGCNVIILKGTVIGENCVIGAGSVVSGNIPKNQIWAGNPAVFIRDINQN
tara:strand:- start:19384 stop:19983 length:600 start_codon:yes stop_codon:yes gene_type:complete